MYFNPFNPFDWFMLGIGAYATAAQLVIMGNPGTVSRDQLGRL